MEGKFASEGLQALDRDDDMLTTMARELVENKRIGESADSVWRNVQQLRPSTPAPPEEERKDTPIEQEDLGMATMPSLTIESRPCTVPAETARAPRGYSRQAMKSAQMSLF